MNLAYLQADKRGEGDSVWLEVKKNGVGYVTAENVTSQFSKRPLLRACE